MIWRKKISSNTFSPIYRDVIVVAAGSLNDG